MVTKEQLVCTKEQSIMLKGKGFIQYSLFEWVEQRDSYGIMNILTDNHGDGFAAFTSAELLERMPKMGTIKKIMFLYKTNLEPTKIAQYILENL